MNSRVKVRGDLVGIVFSIGVSVPGKGLVLPARVASIHWYGRRGSLHALIAHAWEGGNRIDRKNHTESGATGTRYLQCKGGSAVSLRTFP